MARDKYGCEEGFLNGCESFYKSLGDYTLQQFLKHKLETTYGDKAPEILKEQMESRVQRGNDPGDFCKKHLAQHGISSYADQLDNMDISLCCSLLQHNQSNETFLQINQEEYQAVENIRTGRNSFGHYAKSSVSQAEKNHHSWKISSDKLNKVQHSSLMKYIPEDIQKQMEAYCNGTGTYEAPQVQSTIDSQTNATYVRICPVESAQDFMHVISNHSDSRLRHYYKVYPKLMDRHLDPKKSTFLFAKSRFAILSEFNFDCAQYLANKMAEPEKFSYLESCAKRFPDKSIEIYQYLYRENSDPTDHRRYDRMNLTISDTVKQRCLDEMDAHVQDLLNIPLEDYRIAPEKFAPIFALMSSEQKGLIGQREHEAWLPIWECVLSNPLKKQIDWLSSAKDQWFFSETAQQAHQKVCCSISKNYWEEEIEKIQQSMPPNTQKYISHDSPCNKDMEEYRRWEALYQEWKDHYQHYLAQQKQEILHLLEQKTKTFSSSRTSSGISSFDEHKNPYSSPDQIRYKLDEISKLSHSEKKLSQLKELQNHLDRQHFTASVPKKVDISHNDIPFDLSYDKDIRKALKDFQTKQDLQISSTERNKQQLSSLSQEITRLLKETERAVKKQQKRKQIFLRFACAGLLLIVASIAGYFLLRANSSNKANQADKLFAQGQYLEAYTLYDKYAANHEKTEEKRIACLTTIRQTMMANGFREDMIHTTVEFNYNAMESQGEYFTARTDITFVPSINVPAYRNEDGSYQIRMGDYWGELRIPDGMELQAIWDMEVSGNTFRVNALCTDGTILSGETQWVKDSNASVKAETNKAAADLGIDLVATDTNVGPVKHVLFVPASYDTDEVYLWTTSNQLYHIRRSEVIFQDVCGIDLNSYGEYLGVFDSNGARPVPSFSILPDGLTKEDIFDSLGNSDHSFITQDGCYYSNGSWSEGNDWLFFDTDGKPISVYDTILSDWMN